MSNNINKELILFPLPIGELSSAQYITEHHLDRIKSIKFWVAENARTLRRFISGLKIGINIDELDIFEHGIRSDIRDLHQFLSEIQNESIIGLCSEAGIPCVADPGNETVKWAQKNSRRIEPLIGPNSIAMAIEASGLNGQNYIFHGYLPVKEQAFSRLVKSWSQGPYNRYTHVFIEVPYRSDRMLRSLLSELPPQCQLSISIALHTENQSITTKTVAQWKKTSIEIGKTPCVFCLLF